MLMVKKAHTFTNENYNLSTDYKLLWDLIQSGKRVAAWLVYTDEYEKPIWDLVEIKNTFGEKNDYSIGTRGRGYEGAKTFEYFKGICENYSIHFVLPQICNHEWIWVKPNDDNDMRRKCEKCKVHDH